jgi:hypothetical protein
MLEPIVLIIILCIILAIFFISFLCVKNVKPSDKKVGVKNKVRRNTPFYDSWNAVGVNDHYYIDHSGGGFGDSGVSGGECEIGSGDFGGGNADCGGGDCGGGGGCE